MMKSIAELFEKASTYASGFLIIAGVVFLFFGFFDLSDLKSIETRAVVSWGPVIVGAILALIGIAFYLLRQLRPPRPERDPTSLLSGGLIYILRHIGDHGGAFLPGKWGYALYYFNQKSPDAQEYKKYNAGWEKASDYAVRCLTLMGFAESGAEYRITNEGHKALQSDDTRAGFPEAFSRELISKDG